MIICKCGHEDPNYYREDIRPLVAAQNCWRCQEAAIAAVGYN